MATLKPLDIVRTPKGAIAIIKEMNYPSQKGMGNCYSLDFIGDSHGEHNAWWDETDGLQVIDALPSIIARNMIHPFGSGRQPANDFYPKPKTTK